MSWFHRDGDAERTVGELPAALVQLLAAEKDASPPGEVTAGRIGARLERSLGVAFLGGPGPSAPAAGTPAGGVAASGAGAAGPAGLGAALAAKLGTLGGTAVVIGALAAGLGAGAAFVAMGQGASRPTTALRPLPPVPALTMPARPPAPAAPPSAVVVPPAPAPRAAVTSASDAHAGGFVATPRKTRPRAEAGFSAELAALERAGALLRTDPRKALAALYAHERAFADGQLVQERELFIIEAFARAGDAEKAETWAAAFRLRHPGSTLEPRIARALAAGR